MLCYSITVFAYLAKPHDHCILAKMQTKHSLLSFFLQRQINQHGCSPSGAVKLASIATTISHP
nr:MAG TPA: hypothetical protein [Caudoviricetes sp.]